jgi:hypothetical protein
MNPHTLTSTPATFHAQERDVINAKISDHYPVIHHNVLFWNVMMQGKARGISGFNNAFGLIEDEAAYLARLWKVAKAIAAILHVWRQLSCPIRVNYGGRFSYDQFLFFRLCFFR